MLEYRRGSWKEDNVFKKVINRVKDKMHKKNSYPQELEYVFSDDEINKLANENKKKMLALKNNKIIKKSKNIDRNVDELIIDNLDGDVKDNRKDILDYVDSNRDKVTYTKIVKKLNGELVEEVTSEDVNISDRKEKYIELSDELQEKINEAIDSVNLIVLDNYIIKGKDLLQHNYTITYGEESLRFIYQVRNEFEVLIEYLIGFNNEKKGIYDKTIFSDKLDNEWHYLKNYIKILEHIRSIKGK